MADWRDNTGLADGTDVAKIYVDQDLKQEWKKEADKLDRSLSKHLYYLIQEARVLREDDLMYTGKSPVDHEPDDEPVSPDRIDALEKRVTQLEEQLLSED